MDASEVVAALEKALEAYEADKTGYEVAVLITAATAESIRTLLDAHASAVRELAELQTAAISVCEFIEGALPRTGYLRDNERSRLALDRLRRAALDDNTKGAAE